jgi:hypothetical protein
MTTENKPNPEKAGAEDEAAPQAPNPNPEKSEVGGRTSVPQDKPDPNTSVPQDNT